MRKKITREDNFTYLLSSLIFLLFSGACIDEFISGYGQGIILLATIITMVIAIWSIRSTRYIFNTGIVLLSLAILTSLLIKFLNIKEFELIYISLLLLFFLLTLKPALEQALFSGRVTKNNIIGSICIYLLLGLIWTMLYLLITEIFPNSFSGIEVVGWKKNLPDFIYFSFVTLTTLGFGDILAVSPLARFLSYMEAIVGVFYMAIVVSSLVGAKMSESQSDN